MAEDLTGKRVTDHEAIGEAVKAKDDAAKSRDQIKRLKEEAKLLRNQRDEVNSQLDTLLALSESTEIYSIPHEAGKTDRVICPVLLWSDWHIEEEVRPEEVRGLNEFNLDVAHARIERLVDVSVSLINNRKDEFDIEHAVIWLGGDFINGWIHEEFMIGNLLTPTEACLWVKKRLMSAIAHVANHFDKVTVACNTGNHGRLGKKKMSSGISQRSSLEWLLYHTIKDEMSALGGYSHVEWLIPEAYFCEFDVYGHRIRTHHGDAVMYQGGVGGPSIPINKAVAEWNVAETVDIDYFGHLHQVIDHQKWMMNGSLIGYNAFAIDIKARYQDPIQLVDYIQAGKGRAGTDKIYLNN